MIMTSAPSGFSKVDSGETIQKSLAKR